MSTSSTGASRITFTSPTTLAVLSCSKRTPFTQTSKSSPFTSTTPEWATSSRERRTVKMGTTGRVISRASFRRIPRNGKSYFTMMSLHINNHSAKKRGIGNNLLLTVRTAMLQEKVDMVAGDFNGTAWRRQHVFAYPAWPHTFVETRRRAS